MLWQLANRVPSDSAAAGVALAEQASQFLEAGGVLSLSDWAALDERERGAFLAAAKQKRVLDALRLTSKPEDIFSEIDGGERARHKVLIETALRLKHGG